MKRRRFEALSTVMMVSAALTGGAGVGTAQAAPVNHYAAISVNVATGGLGSSYRASSQAKAIATAQAQCKKGTSPQYCRNVAWVRNGCAAVAFRYQGADPVNFGGGYGLTKAKAGAMAIKTAGKGSKVKLAVCSG